MIDIYLTDFAHDGFYGSRTLPYPIALLGSYAQSALGDEVSISLFKEFEDFRYAVKTKKPQIVGVSNYMWNERLGSLAARLVKSEYPEVVIIMGGPNYYDDPQAQHDFLQSNPSVDFYIYKEGEIAFSNLVTALLEAKLDAAALKSSLVQLPSVHYLERGKMVRGPMTPRVLSLDEISSPYLTGILDKFLEKDLSVLLQRTRGCPFTCTFCTEGTEYYNKVARFSTDRFGAELEYCAQRLRDKTGRRETLYIADANFGMFPEDLKVADGLYQLQQEYGWPKKLDVATGKNKKDRVIEVMEKIDSAAPGVARMTASVQSTDLQVLKNIKRSNISLTALIGGVKEDNSKEMLRSYGEVILALPGDNFDTHTKSTKDLIDDGIARIMSNYLVLLPGTEMESPEARKKFEYNTGFRIIPGAHGVYKWDEQEFLSFESIEMVVSNKTMSLSDYLKCIEYDFVIECFYNNKFFDEFLGLLGFLDLSISQYMDEIFQLRDQFPASLDEVFNELVQARKGELWNDRSELIRHYEDNLDEFSKISQNEHKASLATSKSVAVFRHVEDLNSIAYQAMVNYLHRCGKDTENNLKYLKEAAVNSLMRKQRLLDDDVVSQTMHYDFVSMEKLKFKADPCDFLVPSGIKILYKPNNELLARNAYYRQVESSEIVLWRKLLYEKRVDENSSLCRQTEIGESTPNPGDLTDVL